VLSTDDAEADDFIKSQDEGDVITPAPEDLISYDLVPHRCWRRREERQTDKCCGQHTPHQHLPCLPEPAHQQQPAKNDQDSNDPPDLDRYGQPEQRPGSKSPATWQRAGAGNRLEQDDREQQSCGGRAL